MVKYINTRNTDKSTVKALLSIKFSYKLLCYYILMNYLSVCKLIIPTLKASLKAWQKHTEKHTEIMLKQYYSQLISQPSENDNPSFAPNKYEDLIEPMDIFLSQEVEKDIQQEDESTKSNSSYSNRRCQLQRNMLNNRIKSLQYQANNPCEDSLSYDQLKTINAYTISIFDGHGGPELAEYSRSKINTFIDSFLHDHLKKPVKDIGALIKESLKWSYQKIEDTFFQTYQRQLQMGNKKIRNVGTCGITAIVHNDRVYVGNAGDSQAIFILKEGVKMLRTTKACDRLSVNNKYQRQKIVKKWAGIDDGIITEQSNNVFYLKGRLQPTRTIGDYYLKKKEYYMGEDAFKGPYLSCIPQIDEHQITKAHKYMVIASDGIWDALSKNELLNIMMRGDEIDLNKTFNDVIEEEQPPYINNVVKNVLGKASEMSGKSVQQLKNMQKGARRNYHDDITLAVINLQNQLV